MDQSLADRLSRLASEAQDLADTIRDGSDTEGRTRRHAHRLRTHFGIALVLSESLARENGNAPMLSIDDQGETGRVCYTIELDKTEFANVQWQ